MSGPHHPGTDPHTPQDEVGWENFLGSSQGLLGAKAWVGPVCWPASSLQSAPCLLQGLSFSALPAIFSTSSQERMGCPPEPRSPWKSRSLSLRLSPRACYSWADVGRIQLWGFGEWALVSAFNNDYFRRQGNIQGLTFLFHTMGIITWFLSQQVTIRWGDG